MSDAEIMVILILFHIGGFRCFKHYYMEYVCKHLRGLFPRCVSYNRFVELEKGVLLPLTIFIKNVLLGTCTGISFVDSPPPLRVCRNQRISIHKPFEGLAERGKCPMGWFFGFKLHLIVTKAKNNMRNSLMSMAAKILIRKRVLIETVNDELKNIAQLEHSRHRSFNNFVANALSAIAAYCFFEKKPAIDINFINDGQLNLF